MSSIVHKHGVGALEWARKATLGLIEGIPAEQLAAQPWPGANHVLWNLGHLATVDDFFLATVTGCGPALPAEWKGFFFMGSTPHGDLGSYPPPSDVLEALAERRATLLEWFRAVPEALLAQPSPDSIRGFAATLGVLPLTLAWHEGLHAGQISAIRKALGMPPAFG